MTITSVRIYYYPEDAALKLRLSQTHWGFSSWFDRRLKAMKHRLGGAEAKGVNIVNFVLFEDATKAWLLGEWGKRANSFEFDSLYDLQSLANRQPIENIKTLMNYSSVIALRAPWPQAVAVGEALAVPLSSAEESDLLPYLQWPRPDIYMPGGRTSI
jgi:hypothetical protein